jgi:hypothetical protein
MLSVPAAVRQEMNPMTTATGARTGTIRIGPPHRAGDMNHPV